MIDISDMLRRIAEGERNGFYTSPIVKELLAELADLRQQRAEHLVDNRNAHEEGVDAGRDDERASVVAWLRRAAWWDCDDCGFDGKKLVEAIELGLHRAAEGR